MSLRKNLLGAVATFAVAGGLASSASAIDAISCTGSDCVCLFDWGVAAEKDCKPTPTQPPNGKRANKAKGQTSVITPNNYTSFVSLVSGVSANAIPIAAGGAAFPNACKARDDVKDNVAAFKGCQVSNMGVPVSVRIIVS